MKRFILLIAAAWLGLWSAGTVSADIFGTPRMRRVAPKRIPAPMPPDAWDSERVYPQLVVLIEYSDTTFSMPDRRRIITEYSTNAVSTKAPVPDVPQSICLSSPKAYSMCSLT